MIGEATAQKGATDFADEAAHVCPLCSLDFTGAECHSSCPFSRGCKMIRCPRCGFEFVEEGLLVSLVRRFLPRLERTSR